MQVSIAIVKYKNSNQVQNLINDISKVDFKDYEVIVIDNDTLDFTDYYDIPHQIKQFKLHRNYNVGQLAGATNQAIMMSEGKYFVYLCGNHAHINTHDWLKYMVECLGDRAIGGTVSPYQVQGRSGMHVQGGCFIAQTEIIKSIKYDEILFPFSFMDVDLSFQFLKRGYEMVDMPLVKSVMGNIKDKQSFKIYHSHT